MERDTSEACVLSHTLSTDYDANLIKATDNVLKAKDKREKQKYRPIRNSEPLFIFLKIIQSKVNVFQ